ASLGKYLQICRQGVIVTANYFGVGVKGEEFEVALEIRQTSSYKTKFLSTFMLVFALLLQPLLALNIPSAFAAATPVISPTSHTVEGGGGAASEALSSVTGTGFENMKVTFDYNAKKLDTGETLIFGISGDVATEQTITGLPNDNDSEESS